DLVESSFGSLTDRSEYNSRSSKEAELFLVGSDSCACLQEIIQLNARVKPSAHDYRRNLLRIRDIFQRISVYQHEIGLHPWCDCTHVFHDKEFRRVDSRRPECFEQR